MNNMKARLMCVVSANEKRAFLLPFYKSQYEKEQSLDLLETVQIGNVW